MTSLIVLITIIATSLIGYTIIRGFDLVEDKLIAFSYSYGLGIGLIYAQMFMYSLGIGWYRLVLLFPWLIICAAILILKRENFKFKPPRKLKLNNIEYLLIALILILVFYTVFEALLRPTFTWDSWAIWIGEAKAYFLHGRLDKEILEYLKNDYPLALKLYWVFVYGVLGKFNDTSILLTSSAFYVFLLLAFFSTIRTRIGRGKALIFTFLLASVQVMIRQGGRFEAGQADLPLGYFCFISTMLLLDYFKNKRWQTFLLFNSFLAITTLTKMEGLPFALVAGSIGVLTAYRNKLYSHLVLLLFWLIPVMHWRIFRIENALGSYASQGHPFQFSMQKTLDSLVGSIKSLINVKSWGMLWILYFFNLFAFEIRKNKEVLILNVVVVSQLLVYLGSYIFSYGFNPESSAERLLAHMAPIALFCVALISYKYFDLIKDFSKKNH
jgi:hypothetical protein